MTMRFATSDVPIRDACLLRESARRQFRLSLALLLGIAFAVAGHQRQVGGAAAVGAFGHGRVATPTFAPSPAVRMPPMRHGRMMPA